MEAAGKEVDEPDINDCHHRITILTNSYCELATKHSQAVTTIKVLIKTDSKITLQICSYIREPNVKTESRSVISGCVGENCNPT